MVTGIIVAILAALVSVFVSYRITQPFGEIRNGAIRFASGDFGHKIHVPEPYEIGTLVETMNDMASQLEERIQRNAHRLGEKSPAKSDSAHH